MSFTMILLLCFLTLGAFYSCVLGLGVFLLSLFRILKIPVTPEQHDRLHQLENAYFLKLILTVPFIVVGFAILSQLGA